MTRFSTAAAIVAAIAAVGLPAHAKTVKLTVVAAAPPIVTYVKVTKEQFIPEVNRRLAASGKDFKIEWTQAYAQTLAKFNEVFETVEEGIAHVGLVLKNFEPSNLPLEQYTSSAPFAKHSMAQMITIDRNMRKKIPEMNKAYLDHNQVFLDSGVSHSMDLFTKFPVRTVDDLKGHKLGASGAFGQWLRGDGRGGGELLHEPVLHVDQERPLRGLSHQRDPFLRLQDLSGGALHDGDAFRGLADIRDHGQPGHVEEAPRARA